MPGSNNTEYGALYEIACQSGAMSEAAGGVAAGGLVTEENILFAIACNFRNTITALGDTPCGVGFVDQATTWQAILLYSIQLTGLTGTATAFGNMAQPIGGVLCNLIQVGENTGQAPSGIGTGTYLNTLNSIACALAQIVSNGFSPGDTFFLLLNDGSGQVLTNLSENLLLNNAP